MKPSRSDENRGSTTPGARALAVEVLRRVERDDAFLAAALHGELRSWPTLSPRDASLATALAFGTLRTARFLDAALGRHARRGVESFPPKVRWHLRVAAYQLAFLSRVPASAAVNEAVRAAKRVGGEPVARAVNAILRRVATDLADARPSLADAVWTSLPEAFRARVPRSACEGFASGDDAPWTGLRVRADLDRETVARDVQDERPDASVELGSTSPRAVLVRRAGSVDTLACIGDGRAVIQDEGSQLVGLAVGAMPGDRILDACAGRGHKTTLLAEAARPHGQVDAADLHEHKLRIAVRDATALGLTLGTVAAVDWTAGLGPFEPATYDRVLVDAPCTGSGTFLRRPEIALRFSEAKLAELSALQVAIASRCAALVRPGGILVVATCSIFPQEGEALADAIRSTLGLEPWALARFGTPRATLPVELHGTDGYALSAFRRPA